MNHGDMKYMKCGHAMDGTCLYVDMLQFLRLSILEALVRMRLPLPLSVGLRMPFPDGGLLGDMGVVGAEWIYQ